MNAKGPLGPSGNRDPDLPASSSAKQASQVSQATKIVRCFRICLAGGMGLVIGLKFGIVALLIVSVFTIVLVVYFILLGRALGARHTRPQTSYADPRFDPSLVQDQIGNGPDLKFRSTAYEVAVGIGKSLLVAAALFYFGFFGLAAYVFYDISRNGLFPNK